MRPRIQLIIWLFAVGVLIGGAAIPSHAETWQNLLKYAEDISLQGNATPANFKKGQDSAIGLALQSLAEARLTVNDTGPVFGRIFNRLGGFHYLAGHKTTAESLWVAALQINEHSEARDTNEANGSLFRLGLYYHECGGDLANPIVARAMRYWDDLSHIDSPNMVWRAQDAADICQRLMRFAEGDRIVDRMLKAWENHRDWDPSYAIFYLIEIAEGVSKLRATNFPEDQRAQDSAIVLGDRALTIARERFGPKDTLVAWVEARLGDYYVRHGDDSKAAAVWEDSWRINVATLPPEHIEYQGSIFRMGSVFKAAGRYPEAESLYKQAVILRTKTQGPGHPETAFMYMALGSFYLTVGRFDSAETCFQQALSIREKAVGYVAADVAQSLRGLGLVLFDQGHYAAAEQYFRKALAISERDIGPGHPMTISCLKNLADLCRQTARDAEAEEFYQRVLAVRQQFQGADHPDVAGALMSLGDLFTTQGRFAEARASLDRASEILDKSKGLADLAKSRCLSQVARIDLAERRFADAEIKLRESIAIQQHLQGVNDYRLITDMSTLAHACEEQGNRAEVIKLFAHIQSIDSLWHDLDLPEVASSCEEQARFFQSTGDHPRALKMAARAYGIRSANLHDGVRVLAERDALRFASLMRRSRDLYLSLLTDAGPLTSQSQKAVAEIVFATKGEVSDEIFARQRSVTGEADPTSQKLADSLYFARIALSKLWVQGPDANDAEGYRRKLQASQDTKRRLESEIALRRSFTQTGESSSLVNADKIRASLPANSCLLEYVRIDGQAGSARDRGTPPRFLAVVLAVDGGLQVQDLGDANAIDSCVSKYRRHIARLATREVPPDTADLAEYRIIAASLYELIWNPIASSLPESSLVFIAPDGMLGLVSYAGLCDPRHQYLIEKHPIQYLSSGRDLIRLARVHLSGQGLLALGDPDYDATPEQRSSLGRPLLQDSLRFAATDQGKNVRSVCAELNRLQLFRLAGTRTEVEKVASIWKRGPGDRAVTLLSNLASEENFKRSASGNRVIHLATHGFFLDDACPGRDDHANPTREDRVFHENPLLLSGLCLAGANLHGANAERINAEDGILTAEEVCNMNLEGTQLVVLSTCESGLGTSETGEGIYGLQRAFQMAGARTVVSTLWQISDQGTVDMMNDLYSGSSRELPYSIRHIELQRIARLRTSGMVDHPLEWAALIVCGGWQAIR